MGVLTGLGNLFSPSESKKTSSNEEEGLSNFFEKRNKGKGPRFHKKAKKRIHYKSLEKSHFGTFSPVKAF